MENLFTTQKTGLTQAGGAVEIDVKQLFGINVPKKFWQLQVVPSATPSAGTLAIAIKTPGASGFSTLTTTIDMTSTELLISFEAIAEAIKVTPTGFDADKTYSVYLAAV